MEKRKERKNEGMEECEEKKNAGQKFMWCGGEGGCVAKGGSAKGNLRDI